MMSVEDFLTEARQCYDDWDAFGLAQLLEPLEGGQIENLKSYFQVGPPMGTVASDPPDSKGGCSPPETFDQRRTNQRRSVSSPAVLTLRSSSLPSSCMPETSSSIHTMQPQLP